MRTLLQKGPSRLCVIYVQIDLVNTDGYVLIVWLYQGSSLSRGGGRGVGLVCVWGTGVCVETISGKTDK